jgi:hypothetical protein
MFIPAEDPPCRDDQCSGGSRKAQRAEPFAQARELRNIIRTLIVVF